MKKLLILFLSLILAASLTACIPGEQGDQGLPGNDGKDGVAPTIEISPDGYWVINGEKTEYKAIGEDGKDGKPGEDGKDGKPGQDGIDGENGENGQPGTDGVTPTIEISSDGYWVINGEKTEYKAIGNDGKPGASGQDGKPGIDGVTPTISISADGYWVINGIKTEHTAIGKDGQDGKPGENGQDGKPGADGISPTIEISPDGYLVINGVKTEYKVNTADECEHNYVELYVLESTCISRKVVKTCSLCEKITLVEEEPTADHDIVNGKCSVCGVVKYSEGLEFELNADNQSYSVSKIGSCTDKLIVIPDVYNDLPVTAIGDYAFCDSDITEVVIPDSVTAIGDKAFKYCHSLTDVTLSSNLTSIGSEGFSCCTRLMNITLPDTLTEIGESAFSNCTSLIHINAPAGITSIGDKAFLSCINLRVVYNDSDLELEFSKSSNGYLASYAKLIVDSNGTKHYYGNDEYTYVLTDDNFFFKYNDDEYVLFAYCGTEKEITLPDSFNGNSYTIHRMCGAVSITVPNTFTSIDYNAFAFSDVLVKVTLPEGVTSIGRQAFYGCSRLSDITIPNSVVSIDKEAFRDCSSLTAITIPANVTDIGKSAFYLCDRLASITVDENNEYYTSIDGNLYTKDGKTLVQYALGKKDASFTIPDGVTIIGENAFAYCENLVSVTIADSVTEIGALAFDHCTNLVDITFGKANSLTVIGSGAFGHCYILSPIAIPNGVTTIGASAFTYCRTTPYVVISKTVTEIGNSAFYCCDKVTAVYYEGTESEWSSIYIDSNNSPLTNATRYYYSETEPTEDGNFWHYVDGIPTAW